MIFKKGDYIQYSTNGVCLIDDIKEIDAFHTKNPKIFYILKPLGAPSSTIYVPLENDGLVSKMRKVLSKADIDYLIDSVKQDKFNWIADRKERGNKFKQIIKDSDPQNLLKLVDCIYTEQQRLSQSDKKLCSTDKNFLAQAEGLIENEFSFVLGSNGINVGSYIRKRLGI